MNYCPTNHLPWDLAVLLRPYAKITCLRDFKKRKTGEFSSPLLETNYGVPQCFTMTPFLFNICVSEFRYLPLNCRLFQYADDTALIFSDPNYSEATLLMFFRGMSIHSLIGFLSRIVVNRNIIELMFFKNSRKSIELNRHLPHLRSEDTESIELK